MSDFNKDDYLNDLPNADDLSAGQAGPAGGGAPPPGAARPCRGVRPRRGFRRSGDCRERRVRSRADGRRGCARCGFGGRQVL